MKPAMRGVSPCTGQISGKFTDVTGSASVSENVAGPVMQVCSDNECLNVERWNRDDRPSQETGEAGFLLNEVPVIGAELAEFLEQVILDQFQY